MCDVVDHSSKNDQLLENERPRRPLEAEMTTQQHTGTVLEASAFEMLTPEESARVTFGSNLTNMAPKAIRQKALSKNPTGSQFPEI